MKIKIAFTLMAILLCATTYAADSGDLINGEFDWKSRKERAAIATDMLVKINNISKYIPKPSPDQIGWLNRERAAIDKIEVKDEAYLNRLVSYGNSAIFKSEFLFNSLSNINFSLECITQSKVTINKEMACWSKVASLMLDKDRFNDAFDILIKENKVPKSLLIPTPTQACGTFLDLKRKALLSI